MSILKSSIMEAIFLVLKFKEEIYSISDYFCIFSCLCPLKIPSFIGQRKTFPMRAFINISCPYIMIYRRKRRIIPSWSKLWKKSNPFLTAALIFCGLVSHNFQYCGDENTRSEFIRNRMRIKYHQPWHT